MGSAFPAFNGGALSAAFTVCFGLAFAGGALAASSSDAVGRQVEVRFIAPERFTDAEESPADRDRVLKQLASHLIERAEKRLPAQQHLLVEVLDVNLAGEIEPVGRHHERLRVLRGVAWPSMHVHFVLKNGEQVAREGELRLSDMRYLDARPGYPSSETLRYEKRMLDQWLESEFAAAATTTAPAR